MINKKMLNKKMINRQNLLLLIITLGFILCFSLEALAQATLSVKEGAGPPGFFDNEVLISLENQNNPVSGVQFDIYDVGDHLTITGIEATSRAKGFDCNFNELGNGFARIETFSRNLGLIEEGSGSVFIVRFDVKEDAPLEETCTLNLANVSVLDEKKHVIETTEVPGEFSFDSCVVNISPTAETVNSESGIQFSATVTGDCFAPFYTWEVESKIGSVINGQGFYTAGYNDTSAPVIDLITVYDTANTISASAEITVRIPSVRGIIDRISPDWILGSKWASTQHFLVITGDDTYFDSTSRLSFNQGYNIMHIGNYRVEPNKIIAIILLDTNSRKGYVDVTVTTGTEDPYTVTGYNMLRIK